MIKYLKGILALFLSSFILFSYTAEVSANNVKSVIGGTGIAVEGIENVNVSIAETFQLPQGCEIGQVSAWDGIKWFCADNGLTLPFEAIGTWNENGFSLFNTGTAGSAGNFSIDNSANSRYALQASTNGSGSAFNAYTSGNGYAISATTSGDGNALSVRSEGLGMVGVFEVENPDNETDALQIKAGHKGIGFSSHMFGTGMAGAFSIDNPDNPNTSLYVQTRGNGDALGATTFGTGWMANFTTDTGKGLYISVPSGNDGLNVASGTKNAVVATIDGARLLYTEESSQVWFTDYGFGRLSNGVANISIDPIFAQTVNLSDPYHVFVQAYGDANLYVTNRTSNGFEVRSGNANDNPEFSYRLVAKRRGYETFRLERAEWADTDPNLYPVK